MDNLRISDPATYARLVRRAREARRRSTDAADEYRDRCRDALLAGVTNADLARELGLSRQAVGQAAKSYLDRYVSGLGDRRERAVPCGVCSATTWALDALCDSCAAGRDQVTA
jgi:hypothetical protein